MADSQSEPEVVDATVVDDPPQAQPSASGSPAPQETPAAASESPGQELELRPTSGLSARIVSGSDPDEVIANATKIANSLDKLVRAQGFAVNMGGRKPHMEIGAWQALGTMLGALGGEPLHAETVWSRPSGEKTSYIVKEKKYGKVDGKRAVVAENEYEIEGHDWEACVEVKTASGVIVGRAEGMCSRAEASWSKKPDPAVKSMAETRAASRAFRGALGWIVAIAGYNPTPAEEMLAQAAGPAYGPKATQAISEQTQTAIGYVLSAVTPKADHQEVVEIMNKIARSTANADGEGAYVPYIACRAVALVATRVKELLEAAKTASAAPGEDPAQETDEEREDREHGERLADDHAAAA